MKAELDQLYDHIDDIEIAMMTTRRPDGHLESRAMATQKRAEGADLWFVAADGSGKLAEIEDDPHVNLAYYKDRTREWVSVSATAAITRERQEIDELWAPDWQAWFRRVTIRHGTKDDPRMVLIGVFLEVNKPQPVALFELVKGWVTGSTPELGEMHRVEK